MKAVILCGGKGLRMGSRSTSKPLVRIGGMPILWHVMKIYQNYGINEFILCLGHNGPEIKDFFLNLHWRENDFQLEEGEVSYFNPPEPWKIIFADTGEETMTGGRIKRIEKYIQEEEFMLTYGDGVADIQQDKLLEFHRSQGKIATVTGVRPRSNYGFMELEKDLAVDFQEKPLLDAWINGGFFVLQKQVFSYIQGDETVWEADPLRDLARQRQLAVYRHRGFWHAVDTLKDVQELNQRWHRDRPWVQW